GVLQNNLVSGNNNTTTKISNLKIEFGDSKTTTDIPIASGDTIKLNEVLPLGIKIKDFLKSVMTLFNLYMIQDPENDANFIIEPYNTFYKDTINLDVSKSIEWTDKVDFDKYTINSNIDLPKRYEFKYKP